MGDIYRAAKWRGNYPPFSQRLRGIIVLVFSTQKPKKSSLFLSIYRNMVGNETLNARFCLISCLEVNRVRQSWAHKALLTCVVYTNGGYLPSREAAR